MAHWKWSQAGCRRGTPWPDVRRRRWWEKGVVAFRSSSCICLQRAAPNDSIGVGVGPTWVGDPGADRRFRVEDAMQEPGAHTNQQGGGNHRVENKGAPASFLSP